MGLTVFNYVLHNISTTAEMHEKMLLIVAYSMIVAMVTYNLFFAVYHTFFTANHTVNGCLLIFLILSVKIFRIIII